VSEEAKAGGSGNASVPSSWIAIIAAALGLLVVGAVACGLVVWRHRDDSTIPSDNFGMTEDLSVDTTATEMELTALSDYDVAGQLECENPLESGDSGDMGFDGGSGFGSLSDGGIDEGVPIGLL
jgi:hypothetical protein